MGMFLIFSSMSSDRKRGGGSGGGGAALGADANSSASRKRGGGDSKAKDTAEGGGLVFEDPFDDEFDDEQFDEQEGGGLRGAMDDGDDDGGDDEDAVDEEGVAYLRKQQAGRKSAAQEMVDEDDANNAPKQVWRPGVDQLPDGEELEYDPSAYVMYHSLQAEWPCLSFDIVRDNLGENRQWVSTRIGPLSYDLSLVLTSSVPSLTAPPRPSST